MFDFIYIEKLIEILLFASCLFVVIGSIFISCRLRFIQCRLLPNLFRILRSQSKENQPQEGLYSIPPYKALLTAMSTTLGIGTIVGPIVAIYWGGPGALLGFLLTAFFGSAATFTEVGLSIMHRMKMPSGEIRGGPMQYLCKIFSARTAKCYAVFGCILMASWSGANANQLGAILDSPLLGGYRIPTLISGFCVALLVLVTLIGGIKRVGAVSAKIVPLMFVLYLGGCSWIIISNIDKWGQTIETIFLSMFSPYAMASGSIVGGVISALRWGVFKGTQATEAGIGTQAIPHSMAETENPKDQAMLAMVSTYTSGVIAFISGFVILVTDTWQNPELPLGISMMAASFEMYFSFAGIAVIAVCTLLFAFGTILGNCYNGGQCFGYLTNHQKIPCFFIASAIVIFFGTIAGIKEVWTIIDIALAFLVVPHMAALILYTHRNPVDLI